MIPDHWHLYQSMLRSRFFEEAVLNLWNEGKIFGEMHLAIGEEAIPYAHNLEDAVLPNVSLICQAAKKLME